MITWQNCNNKTILNIQCFHKTDDIKSYKTLKTIIFIEI